MIKKISHTTKKQISKYISISVLGYGYVFLSLYVMITIFELNKTISFLIVYGVLYFFLYFIQLKILFKTESNTTKIIKFCLSLILFYIISNILFYFFTEIGFNYLIATFITITIIFPLRFVVSKYYVYK